MTVVLCFGSHRPEVLENIVRISREQDLYAPDVPVAGTEIFDRDYYEAHKEEAEKIRSLLADGQSRLVFDSVIEYKLSGRPDPLFSTSRYSSPRKRQGGELFGKRDIDFGRGNRSRCG